MPKVLPDGKLRHAAPAAEKHPGDGVRLFFENGKDWVKLKSGIPRAKRFAGRVKELLFRAMRRSSGRNNIAATTAGRSGALVTRELSAAQTRTNVARVEQKESHGRRKPETQALVESRQTRVVRATPGNPLLPETPRRGCGLNRRNRH